MDDEALWDAFSASKLPAPEWTHRAHLRVAWMFLERHSFDEAHLLMRVGIVRLNAFHELVETPSRGYHETLTRAWLSLVAASRGTASARSSEAFLDACGESLTTSAVFRHYSREHVMGVRARAIYVEPDLLPLPA